MARSAQSAPWLPTMDSPTPVTHAARLIIAARTTLIVDVTRAFILCIVMGRKVEDITLIVAKEIVALTIVKITEVHAQEVRAKEVRAKEVRAKEVRAKEVRATNKTSMDVTVKEVTIIVSATQMMAMTTGATPGQHLPSDITTVIHLTMQTPPSDDDQFDRAASAIVVAHHAGNTLHSQTVVVGSGATRHMFYYLSVFHKIESIAPTTVKLGDDSTANCSQIGEVVLHLSDGRRLRLSKVLYVPRLAINLLSVSQLAKKSIMTLLTKTGCALIDSDDGNSFLVEESSTLGGLYVITKAVCRASLAAHALSATMASSSSKGMPPLLKDMQILWRARLGHVGFETVTRAAPTGATTGIDFTAHTKNFNCHTCLLQKVSRRPFKGSLVKRASVVGDVIHTDVSGPMPPTISGYKYVQSFIDGRTRLKYIYLLKKKSDAGGVRRDFIVKFEREHDCLVKSVHADKAAEFTGADFNSCLREQGIKFTSSAPFSLESSGLAEDFNKVLFARVRCLLDHSGMDKVLWGEAAHHAVHLLNITPSRSPGNITPYEAAYFVVPDVSKLRVFGCVAFATLPHPKKLNDKAVRATSLGHIGYVKYHLLLPGPDYKIFVATFVKFDEQVFDFAADAVKEVTDIRNITGGDDIISDDMRFLANDDEDEDECAKESKAAMLVDAQNSDNHNGDVNGQEVEEVEEIRRYPLRNRTQTLAWNLAAHATQTPDSPTISSALASTNKDK
jgi:GAG-pre-integrase domain